MALLPEDGGGGGGDDGGEDADFMEAVGLSARRLPPLPHAPEAEESRQIE